MERYTIYCTEEQTKKALELGAPIEVGTEKCTLPDNIMFIKKGQYHVAAIIPTAEQMIGWLDEQGIMFNLKHQKDGYCLISIETEKEIIKMDIDGSIYRNTATLAAIDSALDYLSKNKM